MQRFSDGGRSAGDLRAGFTEGEEGKIVELDPPGGWRGRTCSRDQQVSAVLVSWPEGLPVMCGPGAGPQLRKKMKECKNTLQT